jgi:hypothetical protein
MIDYRTYRRFHPGAPVFYLGQQLRNSYSFRDDSPGPLLQQKHLPNEEDLYMMPPHIHAFVIQDKKWGKLVQLYTSGIIVAKLYSGSQC